MQVSIDASCHRRQIAAVLYLCDNCGEIVLDRLFILQLQKYFPHLQITVMVHGGEVFNDATMRDIRQTYPDEVCPHISSQVPFTGCDLRHIGEDTRVLLASSDMIIVKGQANFESLYGCGLPIYYLFLCKYGYLCEQFRMHYLKGTFAYEKIPEIPSAK